MLSAREHKGHRFVRVRAPRADTAYWVPEGFADLPLAEVVRRLSRQGWSANEIHHATELSYQRVHNILVAERQRSRRKAPADSGGDAVEQDQVGKGVAFGDLVAKVEGGKEVTITRNGEPVAQIVSFPAAQKMAAVRKAIADMDALRRRTSLAGLSVKELINEGRP